VVVFWLPPLAALFNLMTSSSCKAATACRHTLKASTFQTYLSKVMSLQQSWLLFYFIFFIKNFSFK
jgi:hypothetical protein